MIAWIKYSLVAFLSLLYIAYIFEMYRHLTRPLKPFHYLSKKKRIQRLMLFFIGITCTVLVAYTIREFVLPRPIFDLIVVTLQSIFIIPFFGAIFTDHLLHAWRQRRLPYPITLSIVICTGLIGAGSNALILFASSETIEKASHILEVMTDISAVCFLIVLAFLGIGYWHSATK